MVKMAKDWAIIELKQKIEDDISDEKARKSILKLFAKVIEKNHDINPSNWNVSYRTGGTGLRFQLNFGHRYILGVYADSILVMNKRETFLKLPRDFISEILKECEFVNDGTNKTPKPTTVEELENYPPEELWHNSIQFKIPFANCEKYLETLEPAICDFAKWCTENRKKNPQSEDAHVSAFIDYLNQELETDIPQPEYEGEWNPDIEEQLKLYKDFQTEFPIAKIRNLTLKEYNNTERKNAFCYWIETRLRKLGSIQGSTSYKFGIYEYNENPRDDNGYSFDGQYAWLSKYGKSSSEAYTNVHSNIIDIIEAAQHADLDEIEKIDISSMFKWKIAFLYSNLSLINIFSKEALVYLANKYGLESADKASCCVLYQFLLSKKGTEEHILKYSARIWNEWLNSDECKSKKNNIQGDTQMTQEDTLVKKYANLLKNTKNLILTGAPGTGKTYLAKQIAKELGCEDDNIGFVQFHPSYDYTDFVEGLRPTDKDGNGNVGFERRDGVFKEFCAKALKNLVDSRKSVDVLQHERTINEIVEDFLNDAVEKKTQFETHTKNPFSVESFTDRKVFVSIPQNEKVKTLPIPIDDILELISNDVQLNIGKDVSEYFNRKWRTQQDSYIYVLTKQIQKNVKENKNNETVTMEKIQAQNFVFIIDEINRGEVAKIFGELFYSVDPGYRVTSDDLNAIKNGNRTITTIKTQYA
ncbi:MAG: AAA family ATPase, partial [Spirochaetaceae bacterium]|nr:AAA family ATPase [Spirochaetaceae bacterium]